MVSQLQLLHCNLSSRLVLDYNNSWVTDILDIPQEYSYSDSQTLCSDVPKLRDTFIDNLVENLHSRVPDEECLSSFSILPLKNAI